MEDATHVEYVTSTEEQEVTTDENAVKEKDEMSSTQEPEFNQEDVISGWKEDRDRLDSLENENFELKKQIAELQSKDLDSEAEEDGLSRQELIDRELKNREEIEKTKRDLDTSKKAREISFMERTNNTFRQHKAEITKIADDEGLNLSTATEIFLARKQDAKESIKNIDDNRKKSAGQKEVEDAQKEDGKTNKKQKIAKYNPEEDKDKDFGDIYREYL